MVERLKKIGVRVSIFVDPVPDAVKWAAAMGGDRVELYTEPFARAFEAGRGEASFKTYVDAAELAHSLGLGVNAGHDLDLGQPAAVPAAAAPGGGVDRPRAHQPCAVRRSGSIGRRLSRCAAITRAGSEADPARTQGAVLDSCSRVCARARRLWCGSASGASRFVRRTA